MESDKARALRIVQNSELAHPGLPLVEAFLNDAADGDQAARYLLQTYADDGSGTNLTRFLKDWQDLVRLFLMENPNSRNSNLTLKKRVVQRDGYRCCLTGVRCRFWNVFPIIPPTAFCIREQRLYDLLGAFTTSFHRDLLKDQPPENQIRNHWTLSNDIAIAFSRGAIKLEKLEGTEYDILYNHIGGKSPPFYQGREYVWKCDLIDHSNSGVETPNPDLVEIHSRFSRALKWSEIATKINSRPCLRQSRNTDCSSFGRTISTIFLALWSKFPDSIRFQTYRILRTIGYRLYGSTTTGIQRLPFGMYLKHGPEFHAKRHAGEFNALKVVGSQTCIPIPRPIDLLLTDTESFLVTSRIKGGPVGLAIDECSDEEMQRMAQDLRSWVAELHAIKMDKHPKYAITNATGGPCLDYRIGGDPVGPFHTEREFSESLQLGILPDLVHRTDHRIVFTHADLNMRNILVNNGRISGIVDWENAGWFPEYWEYTKCHFGVMYSKRWLKMIEVVFENKYEAELAIEKQYWAYNSAW